MDACEDGMTTEAAATLTHTALKATVAKVTRLNLGGRKLDTVFAPRGKQWRTLFVRPGAYAANLKTF
jgi:hypothetical protein